MTQRISVNFNRANLGNADRELTEEMLTDAAGCVLHGDDSTAMMAMQRRFIAARGLVIAFDDEIQRWTIKSTDQDIHAPIIALKTKSEAYQFALECIVNTGGDSELEYTRLERDNLFAQAADDTRYIKQCESTIKEQEELLAAEKRERLLASEFVYAEQKRLSALIDKHLTDSANANRKYLELVALISYYTEDNKGLPYCRDVRGEVAKAAAEALKEVQTVK